MHIHADHLPGSRLWLRFGCAGDHVKLFRRVVCGRLCQLVRAGRSDEARPGERACIKNAKLSPNVGFVHVRAAHFLGSPLWLRFSPAGT